MTKHRHRPLCEGLWRMFWHITKLFLADLLALAIVAGVILLLAAGWTLLTGGTP